MTESFLSEDNLCGQHLLKLASRGSAIVAELLRLSEHIPAIFYQNPTNPFHGGKDSGPIGPASFNDLIIDFRYFKVQDQFEKYVQSSPQRLELDDSFRVSNLIILDRFYGLFDSIFGYTEDLGRFYSDMKEGVFISQTFESILSNPDGRQLLSECFYLFGVMLLLLEGKIEGTVRERMLISYLRYKGRGEVRDKVCQMCASTGQQRDPRRPNPGYPDEFFARIPIPTDVIHMIIGRIRSDDIYNMAANYPTPEHRSTALSQQAAILYVLLFFIPDVLHNQTQIMREITYKHFNDNWVIVWYLGYTADITYTWQNYKAASAAINEAITLETVDYVTKRMKTNLVKLNTEMDAVLREGVMTEQYALENIQASLLPKIREANVTLRWFILHTTRGYSRKINELMKPRYDVVMANYNSEDVLSLLLSTAQLEFLLRNMFEALIKTKKSRWNTAKEKAMKKMNTLATYFSGEHALSDGVKETQLQGWFSETATRIEELDYRDSTSAGRKIQKLLDALVDVQEFHQINSNMQVMQFLQDTRELLKQMIRYVNIEKKVLVTIMTVGDLSYAWELMNDYNHFVGEMQSKIRKKPHLVLQMRSTFLKLATLIEGPLTRIAQAANGDELLTLAMESVSEYYSTKLVAFVRKVLHVIPVTIFEKLKDIVRIQVAQLKECPTKVPKDALKEYAQLDIRTRYANLTSEIAKFADGILALERTLVGVIHIDPQRLLEEGIRRELVEKVSFELNKALRFDEQKRAVIVEDVDNHLTALSNLLGGMKTSLEYIQDYIGIYGLKTWQEEYSRIINFNVEMECNTFMLKYVSHWQSAYQSDVVPIPYFEPKDDTYGFLGRLVKVLLTITDPRRCWYVQHLGAWYDPQKVWKEVVGPRLFSRIHTSIATQGINGLDRLLCFIIVKELKGVLGRIRSTIGNLTNGNNNRLLALQNLLAPFSSLPKDAQRYYNEWSAFKFEFVEALGVIGRAQLIRKHVANELRFSVKLHSGAMHKAVNALNQAIITDVQAHYSHPEDNPYPAAGISALTPFLDACGMGESISKIYITSEPLPELSIVLFLQFLRVVPRFTYDERMDALVPRKREDPIDACGVVIGMLTVVQQFHRSFRDQFFDMISQFVRVQMNDFDGVDRKVKEKEVIPNDALLAIHFLDLFSLILGVPFDEVSRSIPMHVVMRAKALPTKK